MGAWGFDELDSDQALDWLANEVTSRVEPNLRHLLSEYWIRKDLSGQHEAVLEFALELRAAAYVILALNYWEEEIHDQYLQVLRELRDDQEWINDWSEPEALLKSLDAQISELEKGSESLL